MSGIPSKYSPEKVDVCGENCCEPPPPTTTTTTTASNEFKDICYFMTADSTAQSAPCPHCSVVLVSSLLFHTGQTAVRLSGAEAANGPNALPLINQWVIKTS